MYIHVLDICAHILPTHAYIKGLEKQWDVTCPPPAHKPPGFFQFGGEFGEAVCALVVRLCVNDLYTYIHTYMYDLMTVSVMMVCTCVCACGALMC